MEFVGESETKHACNVHHAFLSRDIFRTWCSTYRVFYSFSIDATPRCVWDGDIRMYASERNTLQRSWLHTRSLRHCRLSTAFPRPVFLRASLSLANGTPLRDSLVAHRPMHSGERTCLLLHDNNDGNNWSPSLSAFHVSIGGREKNRRVLPRLERLIKKTVISKNFLILSKDRC